MPTPPDSDPRRPGAPRRARDTGRLKPDGSSRAPSGPLQEAARRRATGELQPGSGRLKPATGGLKRPATGGLKGTGAAKRGATGGLKGGTGGLKGKRRKGQTGPLGKRRKRKKSVFERYLPQLVGAGTLLAVLGGVGLFAASAIRPPAAPSPSPTAAAARPADALPRPALGPARVRAAAPARPGAAGHPPDSLYAAGASDLADQPAIAGLVKQGAVTVFADGEFKAQVPVSRAEAWAWLYGAVMAQTVPGADPLKPVKRAFPAPAEAPVAPDVRPDYWAAPMLGALKAAGWLPAGALHPEAGLSRHDLLSWASAWVPPAVAVAPVPPGPEAPGAPTGALEPARQAAAQLEAKAAEASSAAAPVDPAALAFRKANYTDYESLAPAERALAEAWYGAPERERWLAAAFPKPAAPGPFPWKQPVTRGELARFLGASSEALGAAL